MSYFRNLTLLDGCLFVTMPHYTVVITQLAVNLVLTSCLLPTHTGLWFFSRKPVDPESTAEMQAVAEDLGLDTSKMQIVQQQGCRYEGAS
jgi:lipocalin